jgi:hypothetical protein
LFLIQGGHQSSTQIAAAVPDGNVDGTVWSPADERPELLAQRVAEAADHGAVQAIDPQLYVAMLEDPNSKRLPEYELFELPLPSRQFSARRLAGLVERVLDFQISLPVTHLLAPTVAITSMSDRTAQIALNLAETSLDTVEDRRETRPLLLSVAADHSVLADQESVDILLDELTSHDTDGYYLLLEIDPRSDAGRQAQLLSEGLYITHTLGTLQDKPVWVGYAGLSGYLHRAVGAEVFSAGWFQKQQWFSTSHWGPGGGGRAPLPRIFLDSILGSLLVEAEMDSARSQRRDLELGADLLRGPGPLSDLARGGGPMPAIDRSICAAQLYGVCMELDRRIQEDVLTNLQRIDQELIEADDLYRRLRDAGIELDGRSSGSQIGVWRSALEQFSDRADL